MQFHVPQFIDVEDKIFGPFSAKQFMYIGGAVGSFFIFFSITNSFVFGLLLASPFIGLGVAFAFYKINNRPFIYVVEAGFKYLMSSRLYIWKKAPKKAEASQNGEGGSSSDLFVPKLSDSKLKDLAWSLDVQEKKKAGERRNI